MEIKDYPGWVEEKIITEGQARVQENILGLGGECGEVLEKVKKLIRDDTRFTNEDIAKELGDILFYSVATANLFNFGTPLYEEARGDTSIKDTLVMDTALMFSTAGKVLGVLPQLITWDDDEDLAEDLVHKLQECIGELILWIIQVARHFDMTMQDIIDINVDKLDGREQRGTIRGSGDER